MKISIYDEEIKDTTCFNCGAEIELFDTPFILDFDPGEPDTKEYPGSPPMVFLICQKCSKDWLEGKY